LPDDRRDRQQNDGGSREPPRCGAPHVRAIVAHAAAQARRRAGSTTTWAGPTAKFPDMTSRRGSYRARASRESWWGAYQTVEEIGMIRSMAQGLRELVGRVMIDPDFLAELQRTPEPLLAEYELSDAERATVRQALIRLARTPSSERRHAFRSSLISRVAT